MEASLDAGMIARIGEVVALVGAGHPHGRLDAGVQYDLLGQAEAQVIVEKLAIGLDIHGQPVEVIQPAYVAAAPGKSLRLVFERRPQLRRSLVDPTVGQLAETGGVTQVTLSEGQLPLHTHQPYANREPAEVQAPGPDRALAHSTPGYAYQGEVDLVEMNEQATSRVGEDAPHNNMPPVQVLRFCIAYEGVFPPRS